MVIKSKKRPLILHYTILKLDSINIMDYMHISGILHPSVILSQNVV